MLKPLLCLSGAILFGFTSQSFNGRSGSHDLGREGQEPTAAPASAPTDAAPNTAKNPVKPTAESQAKAKKIYGYDCALCHGDNGNGKTDLAKDMGLTLSDWTSPASLAGKSDGELYDAITKGKGKMPAEDAGRAKPDEIWNLIIYIRRMSKEQNTPSINR